MAVGKAAASERPHVMPQKTRPPFRIEDCVALAYVNGRYTPPGPKVGPAGFLGIYIRKTDPRLSFWTFDRKGRRGAFSVATAEELNVEYALIVGWLHYDVPFDQWRLYDVRKSDAVELRRLKLRDDHNEARKRLGAVLYQARIGTYFGLPKLKPIFSIRARSAASLKKDVAEREAVMNSVGLR